MTGIIEKYWSVECPTCAIDVISFKRRDLIQILKDNKWKRYKDRWFCPFCVEQNKHKIDIGIKF